MKKFLREVTVATSVSVAAILAVIMLIWRFYGLHETCIYDEVYTWVTAHPAISFDTAWNGILRQDVNLPLYNLLLRAWAHIVPFTIPWLRFFSVLFSWMTIPAAWFAAPRQWSKLQKFALCCLLACSAPITMFGYVLRAYAMGILFTAVFSLLALRILHAFAERRTILPKLWIGFYVTGFIGAYTHFFASGLFFITALFLFIFACIYKRDRFLVFVATGVCFCLWIPWLLNTYQSTGHFEIGWWYETSKILSSWQIMEFSLGNSVMLGGLFLFLIVGLVSLGFNARKTIKKTPEVFLPIFQIGMLVGVLLALSAKYNLFTERYFLLTLPCFFILLVALWDHLCKRWIGFIVLLPVFLYANVTYYYHHFSPRLKEFSGLTQSFEYVEHALGSKKVMLLMDPLTYPGKSVDMFVQFFVPKNSQLEIIPLTKENSIRMKAPERLPLVVPLCSFYRAMMASVDYNFNVSEHIVSFEQTCIIQDDNL